MPPADTPSRPAAASRLVAALLALLAFLPLAHASERVPVHSAHHLNADDPRWRELAAQFAQQPDVVATFTEQRFFPFRREPVALAGEVRVSRLHGLSLHYTQPEDRIVILDDHGVLVRDASGEQLPPDPRAAAANRALLHVLRFDLPALTRDFEIYGRRDATRWSLTLVPHAADLRRSLGHIHVSGRGGFVEAIELRRSAKQHIDIALTIVRAPANFTAKETQRYFR